MARACFLLQVRPDRLPGYLGAHEHVWPEMLEALTRCGWRNYSLFVRRSDGLVVGYFESDDVAAAMEAMDREEVNARWQETMRPYLERASEDNAEAPRLREYFHLP